MGIQLYDGLLCGLPTEIALDLMWDMVEGRNIPSSLENTIEGGGALGELKV